LFIFFSCGPAYLFLWTKKTSAPFYHEFCLCRLPKIVLSVGFADLSLCISDSFRCVEVLFHLSETLAITDVSVLIEEIWSWVIFSALSQSREQSLVPNMPFVLVSGPSGCEGYCGWMVHRTTTRHLCKCMQLFKLHSCHP